MTDSRENNSVLLHGTRIDRLLFSNSIRDSPHNEYFGTGYGLKSFHFESVTLSATQWKAVRFVRASNCVTVKPCGVHGAKSINVTNARYSPERPRSYVANTYGTPFILWGFLSARCQTINAFSIYIRRHVYV